MARVVTGHLDAPRDFLPVGLKPEQLTSEQQAADMHARMNIGIAIRDVRPWLSPQQSRDPKLVEEFMRGR